MSTITTTTILVRMLGAEQAIVYHVASNGYKGWRDRLEYAFTPDVVSRVLDNLVSLGALRKPLSGEYSPYRQRPYRDDEYAYTNGIKYMVQIWMENGCPRYLDQNWYAFLMAWQSSEIYKRLTTPKELEM